MLRPVCPCFAFGRLPPKRSNFPVPLCGEIICQNTLSLGAVPWSSSPSHLWFRLPWVKHDLCFSIFAEEEQSWALFVLRRLSGECLHRLKVLQPVLNPVG